MSNTKTFGKYAQQYGINNHKIKLKLKHSIKVAKLSKEIASKLFSDEKLVELAYNIGLLHDISRFEQWNSFETFIDRDSFDHGDYSTYLLFEKKLINDFEFDPEFYPYCYIAIKNHNKLQINDELLDKFCEEMNIDKNLAKTFCLIIRDADKLDIARVFVENPSDMDFPTYAQPTGYSPKMMQDFKSHRLCDYKNRRSVVDFALGYLAFPFDFNFDISNVIFARTSEDYANAVKTRYYNSLSNPSDKQTLQESCDYLVEQFKKYKELEQ